jgi:hypothetical protein
MYRQIGTPKHEEMAEALLGGLQPPDTWANQLPHPARSSQ